MSYGPAYQRDVVTGEAVALDLRIAQLPSRALALMIDMAAQVALLFGAFFLLGVLPGSLDQAMLAAVTLVLVVAVLVGYPLTFETMTRGRSLGKIAFGLRVVRDDGGAVRFRHALVRALIEVVEIWLLIGVPALFCSLVNGRSKRFGDLAAGTVVIRERVQGRAESQPGIPPELVAWVSTVDVGRVPDDLALAARQYLARAPQLRPDVSWTMAVRLASDLSPYLMPAPPAQVPPDRLLAAVVAQRRHREEARLGAQAAATRTWTDTGHAPGSAAPASATAATVTAAAAPYPDPPADRGTRIDPGRPTGSGPAAGPAQPSQPSTAAPSDDPAPSDGFAAPG